MAGRKRYLCVHASSPLYLVGVVVRTREVLDASSAFLNDSPTGQLALDQRGVVTMATVTSAMRSRCDRTTCRHCPQFTRVASGSRMAMARAFADRAAQTAEPDKRPAVQKRPTSSCELHIKAATNSDQPYLPLLSSVTVRNADCWPRWLSQLSRSWKCRSIASDLGMTLHLYAG